MTDRPEPGKVYALTGGSDTPAISNGNTWAESEVQDHYFEATSGVVHLGQRGRFGWIARCNGRSQQGMGSAGPATCKRCLA